MLDLVVGAPRAAGRDRSGLEPRGVVRTSTISTL